ncbi:MAG TPA: dihydropteroate synthase [Cyclobacteriaceae bacterium]|nr:dihydropteroate synthase [Cyclobacteriaceae bacterium]
MTKIAKQNTVFSTNKTLNIKGRLVDLTVPKIMGVLNVTPDSFFDGGRYLQETEILKQVEKMLSEGAWFIDVGGYSSRPHADDIPIHEELRRVMFTLRIIQKEFPDAWVTIDTFRSEVARVALEEGAVMINDISAGQLDSAMSDVVLKYNVPYVIMHMRGNPRTMSQLVDYDNLVKDIIDYFHQIIFSLNQKGIHDIIIDPGFGFAKTAGQSFQLLNHLHMLKTLGKPILAGLSRKSMIWRTLNVSPEEALNGTTALNAIALQNGASILRVHDVKAASETVQLMEKLCSK